MTARQQLARLIAELRFQAGTLLSNNAVSAEPATVRPRPASRDDTHDRARRTAGGRHGRLRLGACHLHVASCAGIRRSVFNGQPAPRLENSTLSLASAVQTALEHNTPIALANQALKPRSGGSGKPRACSIRSCPSHLQWTMQPLAPGLLVGFAQRNRDALSSVIEGFRRVVTDGLQRSIDTDANVRPICPANLLPSLRGFGFSTPLTGAR